MKRILLTYRHYCLLLLVLLGWGSINSYAQNALQRREGISRDSIQRQIIKQDSLLLISDSLNNIKRIDDENRRQIQELEKPVEATSLIQKNDSANQELKIPKERFTPNPNRSVWLALVIPGGGQIYNRKYWKLPLVYGGFVGCTYALNWNNQMYRDYSQAYLDIMDDDPNTKSYEDFLPPSMSIKGQEARYQEIFRKRKDLYRRQRDLSIFCLIGL